MLMLQRASGLEANEEECDAMAKLICSADPENSLCPAACKANEEDNGDEEPVVVKSGDLVVTAEANDGASVVSNGATSEMDTLTFNASEDVTINSITLERYGLSTSDAIDSIWLEDEEGNKVTAEKGISSSKDSVTLSFKKGYRDMGTESSFVVVVRSANTGSTNLGTNIGFKVIDVDSSAENLNISKYKANLYDFVDYNTDGVRVEFKGTNSTKSYNYAEGESYEVAKFRVYANKAAVSVDGFTLTNSGNLDLSLVDDVEVLADGKAIEGVNFSTKKDEISVSFDSQEIAISKSVTFTVKVALADFDDFGDTINLKFDDESDINIVEVKNSVRVKVTGDDLSPTTYTFNGGKVTLTNTKLSKTIDAAQGSDGVVVAEGKISIGGQALKISELTVAPTNHTGDVSAIKFIVNGEEYEATSKNSWTVKKVTIDEDATIRIAVDLENNATLYDSISFTIGSSEGILNSTALAGKISYDVNGDPVNDIAGSINVSTLKVQTAKASLINNLSKKAEFKVKDSGKNTVFDGTFTSKKQAAHLNNVAISGTTSLTANDSLTFTVYVDGEQVASFDYKAGYTGENADFAAIDVEAGKSVSVKVVADAYASAETSSDIALKLILAGEDDNNNPVTTDEVDLVKMAFVGSEAITVATNASMKKQDIILTDSNQVIASFILKPGNKAESATLDELAFSGNYALGLLNSGNVEEYFEVSVDGEVLDLSYDETKELIIANDINIDLEGETPVKVVYKKSLTTGDYVLALDTANSNTGLNREFMRKAVNSLVRVATQEGEDSSESKYTFEIEFSSDANNETIQSVEFTYKNTIVALAGTGREWTNVQEGETYTVPNNETVNYVSQIKYVDGDGNTVTITGAYADFFKVGGSDLKAFASK